MPKHITILYGQEIRTTHLPTFNIQQTYADDPYCNIIIGKTLDAFPHIEKVPGPRNQWLLAGFNGAGMMIIFTTARAIAKMITTP